MIMTTYFRSIIYFTISITKCGGYRPLQIHSGLQQSEDQRDKTLPLTNKRVSGNLIDAILFLSVKLSFFSPSNLKRSSFVTFPSVFLMASLSVSATLTSAHLATFSGLPPDKESSG